MYLSILKKDLKRKKAMNIIVLLIVNLALGFVMPGIDNAGHIGGLIGGFLAAAAVGMPKKSKWYYQLATVLILVAGSVALIVYGFNKQTDNNFDVTLSALAQEYIELGEKTKAEAVLTNAVNANSDSPNAYFLLGNLAIDKNDYEKAQQYYMQTIEKKQQFHQAHYNLALTYLQQGMVPQAKEHVAIALEIEPSESSYQELEKEIDDWLNKNDE